MENYKIKQIERAEEEHDWTYKMSVVFSGTKNKSNYLSITKEQLKRIKEVLEDE